MDLAPRRVLARLMPEALRPAARRLYYFGLRFRCPFCGSNLRALAPTGIDFPVLAEKQVIGGGRRNNAKCPSCGSSDRERLVYLYLQEQRLLSGEAVKLLHVAPEPQLRKHIEALANIDYTTADLQAPDVDVQMDITDIQREDGSFDAIICNHVLEHIPNDRQAMAELLRVLKPGGWAILQVPISAVLDETFEDPTVQTEAERERVFGQFDHVRIYGKDYVQRLSDVGFSVDVFDWTAHGEAYGAPSNRFALNPEEALFLVRKLPSDD